jgi:hypothetical protein
MRDTGLTTVFTAQTSREAESIIGWLRTEGLHPAVLGVTQPMRIEHEAQDFPVEVPVEEVEKAKNALQHRPRAGA